MAIDWYQLRAQDGSVILSAADVGALGLETASSISERALRQRLHLLTRAALAQTIHAMLDQEEPDVIVSIIPIDSDA